MNFELNFVGNLPGETEVDSVKGMVGALIESEPTWLRSGVINLKLVDDVIIQAFNKEYSGNDYPTDVLSFSYIDGSSSLSQPFQELPGSFELFELGDIMVSLETAKRQAEEAGIELGEELATLVLHGILHIHGFDHSEVHGRQVMDSLQSDILSIAKIRYRDFNWV